MYNEVKKVAKANKKITVSQFEHDFADQPSVIAQLPGETDDISKNPRRAFKTSLLTL